MTCALASGETRARSATATTSPVVASRPATTSANLTEFQTSTAFDSGRADLVRELGRAEGDRDRAADLYVALGIHVPYRFIQTRPPSTATAAGCTFLRQIIAPEVPVPAATRALILFTPPSGWAVIAELEVLGWVERRRARQRRRIAPRSRWGLATHPHRFLYIDEAQVRKRYLPDSPRAGLQHPL